MGLNNVTFETIAGGLGRLPDTKDHISAIIIDVPAIATWDSSLGHRYLSVDQAEADGIISTSPTYAMLHYFISEFFRMAGPSELYVIRSGDGAFGADGIYNLTKGELRQAFYYDETALSGITTAVTAIKTLSDGLKEKFAPCVFVLGVKDEATAVSTSLADLRAIGEDNVTVVIGGDGSGAGMALADSLSVNCISGGATFLGCLSKAQVHENVGWVNAFPLADLTEFQEAILSDGTSVRTAPVALLTDLNNKGYVFPRIHQGLNGTFWSDTHTTAAATDDTNALELTRTLQKAQRGLRAALLPDLNSPLIVQEDGTLQPDVVKYFENKASRPMNDMANAGEVSNFSVTIDPDQDVLTTGKLVILVKIQPVGVAREIAVNIGFAVRIS